jgi:superfamily II DNA or RNA helicase
MPKQDSKKEDLRDDIRISLKSLPIKQSYDSDRDKPLYDFYIPVLSVATSYKRITGSFSSGILAKAALGIAGLIVNGGKMQLLAGVEVNQRDFDAMKESVDSPEKYINDLMEHEVGDIEAFLSNDFVQALAWMLANGLLEIRIGVVPPGNLSHMKVGIIEDKEGNSLSFSGSNNETPSGWEHNIEEFKVFRGWVEQEKGYFESDTSKFSDLWEGRGKRIKVFNLPQAISDKIIRSAKKNGPPKLIQDLSAMSPKIERFKPREDQLKAFEAWREKKHMGIFEMATGTGKTFAGLMCLNYILEQHKRLVCVIAAPGEILVSQWQEDLLEAARSGSEDYFGKLSSIRPDRKIIASGENQSWRKELINALHDLKNSEGGSLLIFTTHATLSSPDFISRIQSDTALPSMLIVDEVHGLGAVKRKEGLLDVYSMRLGLSATPVRYMDEEGTDFLIKYFGGIAYTLLMDEAIKKGYLARYNYWPFFVELTAEEREEYQLLSEKISKYSAIARNNPDFGNSMERLLHQRANIIKSATNKIDALEDIYKDVVARFGDFRDVLIYCDVGGQLAHAMTRLRNIGVLSHRLTGEEGKTVKEQYGDRSERQKILDDFQDGHYQALVAMKVLDEGVNIPSAKIGIFLASTGNPREYIQRRGRLLRRIPGKKEVAYIYDVLVAPPVGAKAEEAKYYLQEWKRFKEFARSAENAAESLNIVIAKEAEIGLI